MHVMNCVSCGKSMSRAGKTERCACGGAWVPESALLAMAEQMTGTFLMLPWKPRKGAVRSCPQCGQGMVPVSVESVALDRCESHGIWFDPEELQTVLQRAAKFPEGGVPEERFPTGQPNPFNAVPGDPIQTASRGGFEWSRVEDALGETSYDSSTAGSLGTFVGSLFGSRR